MKKILLSVLILCNCNAMGQNLVSVTRNVWQDQNWVGDWRDLYTYDAQNLQTYHLRQDWNTTDNNWRNQSQTNVTFNEDNLPNYAAADSWLHATSQWTPWMRQYNTFNANGDYLQRIYQSLSGGNWFNQYIYNYLYDENGYLVEHTFEGWGTSAISIHDKYIYTNTEDGRALTMVHQRKNLVTGEWLNYDREIYTYNSFNKIDTKTKENWELEAWYPSSKTFCHYDVGQFLINETYNSWMVDHFLTTSQSIITNDSDGNKLSVLHQGVDFEHGSGWVNISELVYQYETLGRQSFENTDLFSIAQNPVDQNLDVYLVQKEAGTMTISDVSGKNIMGKTISSNVERLDLSHISSGIYFLKTTQNGKWSVKKIIKN